MKSFKEHIFEKLKVSARNTTEHTLFPESTDELKQMIKDEISKNGNECSLNHIDVSKITDMSQLFSGTDIGGDISEFNGDISDWNVSNVIDMSKMFLGSEFNGDISDWNVSHVTNMYCMFYNSDFNGDISDWDVSKVTNMKFMFTDSKFNGDISNWDVSKVTNMKYIFNRSPLFKNPPVWYNK